jgi:hypothetical protein
MAATALSAGVSAYGAIQNGRAQYQAEMYNAEIANRNAQSVEDEQANVKDEAAIERRRLGERVRAARGDLIAKNTAMGIDPGFGSAADVIGDVERGYDIDRSILGKNEMTALGRLDKERADHLDSASMSRASAKGALKAGNLAAVGSILDGGGTVASRWIMPSPANDTLPSPTQRKKPAPVTQSGIKVGGY